MGKGIKGQASPFSFAALGSGAFGGGSAITTARTQPETTCQHRARVFELCPVVISCIGTPFWVACLQSILSNKPRPCPRPPNIRQNAVLARQTVHVSLAVAVALHRPAAMAVAGAARARPRYSRGCSTPFQPIKKCPAFRCDLPA